MTKYLTIPMVIFLISCSGSKGVYWCGDHPCINNKEKEAYFKKTMIVEIRNYDKNKIKNDSEIQKLLDQAKIDEKKRILSEKELVKKNKVKEKELAKQIKLDEKRRIKEEKELAKQIELDEKRRIKDEKKLAKQIKKEKKSSEKASTKNVLKVENKEISENNFDDLINQIIKRNNSRPYPDINDIPN